MLLSRKWLDEFVHVDANDKDFAETMTLSGSKVETTEDRGAEISNIVVGTILSMVFLILYLLRHRDKTPSDDVPRSGGYLLRRILAIGVPITLGNCAMSIITMIDTKIILGRLQYGLGLTEVAASALKGQ